MSTLELIEAARAAEAALMAAKNAFKGAAQALTDAQNDLDAKAQALHDELEMNGPCLYLDESTDPLTYYVYAAEGDDEYSATPIRIAA